MTTHYSEHARQRRRERGITRDRVDRVLRYGTRRWDSNHRTWQFNYTTSNGTRYRVCVTPRRDGDRIITTVIRLN